MTAAAGGVTVGAAASAEGAVGRMIVVLIGAAAEVAACCMIGAPATGVVTGSLTLGAAEVVGGCIKILPASEEG